MDSLNSALVTGLTLSHVCGRHAACVRMCPHVMNSRQFQEPLPTSSSSPPVCISLSAVIRSAYSTFSWVVDSQTLHHLLLDLRSVALTAEHMFHGGKPLSSSSSFLKLVLFGLVFLWICANTHSFLFTALFHVAGNLCCRFNLNKDVRLPHFYLLVISA